MKILNGERGSGKTTKAIECAYHTNSLLIVPNRQTAGYIQAKANSHLKEKFGAEPGTVTVMSIYDVVNGKFRGLSGIKGVVIDELDWVVDAILGQFGLPDKVYLATRTGEDATIQKNYSPTVDYIEGVVTTTVRLDDKTALAWLGDAIAEKMAREKQ